MAITVIFLEFLVTILDAAVQCMHHMGQDSDKRVNIDSKAKIRHVFASHLIYISRVNDNGSHVEWSHLQNLQPAVQNVSSSWWKIRNIS